MQANRRRFFSLYLIAGLAGVTALACLRADLSLQATLVPLFGPWAGLLYGHSDCTMGNVIPLWSIGAGLLLAGGLAGVLSPRGTAGTALSHVAAITGAVGWLGLALLSLANASS